MKCPKCNSTKISKNGRHRGKDSGTVRSQKKYPIAKS